MSIAIGRRMLGYMALQSARNKEIN